MAWPGLSHLHEQLSFAAQLAGSARLFLDKRAGGLLCFGVSSDPELEYESFHKLEQCTLQPDSLAVEKNAQGRVRLLFVLSIVPVVQRV